MARILQNDNMEMKILHTILPWEPFNKPFSRMRISDSPVDEAGGQPG
jgi:hypothetical protein